MEIEEIKSILVNWGKQKSLIKRIFVFGSRVRSTHRPDSDLDIAIKLDEASLPLTDRSGGFTTWIDENMGWKEELEKLIPLTIQLEWYQGDETSTINEGLQKSSVVIYEKAT